MKAAKHSFFDRIALAGVAERSHGESRYVWALFQRKDVPENLIAMHRECVSEDIEDFDLAHALTGWEEYHHGVGRAFGGAPYCKIGRNHILVKQFRGLDI